MRLLLITFGCVSVLACLSGCQTGATDPRLAPDLDAKTNAGKPFPESMVGVWQAKVTRHSKWGFKFEPDGSISKLIHSLAGPIRVSEGGRYLEGPDEGTYAWYVMGPCQTEYDEQAQVLQVTVVLDHYTMKLPTGTLQGRSEDYFEGTVSKDGKTWQADWRGYSWLEGAASPDPEKIDAKPVKLLFNRVEFDQDQD